MAITAASSMAMPDHAAQVPFFGTRGIHVAIPPSPAVNCDVCGTIQLESVGRVKDLMQKMIADILTGKSDDLALQSSISEIRNEFVRIPELGDLADTIDHFLGLVRSLMTRHDKLTTDLNTCNSEIEELHKTLARLEYEAQRDAMTGLFNRRYFDEVFENLAIKAETSDRKLTLIIADIDFFKRFNDRYGHAVGDQVLRVVGQLLLKGTKGGDIAARFGGEEFVVILPDTEVEGGLALAEKLRSTLEQKTLVCRSTSTSYGRITMSFGVAEKISGETQQQLFERADRALLLAKKNGRNRVEISAQPLAV